MNNCATCSMRVKPYISKEIDSQLMDKGFKFDNGAIYYDDFENNIHFTISVFKKDIIIGNDLDDGYSVQCIVEKEKITSIDKIFEIFETIKKSKFKLKDDFNDEIFK